MKRITLSIILGSLLFGFSALAQNQEPTDPWQLWLNPGTKDFATIQQQVEAYYSHRDKGRGSGYKHWKRWERLNSSRLDGNGQIQNWSQKALEEYHRYEHIIANNASRSTTGYWNCVGPTDYVRVGNGYTGGIGRVNCIAFHPTDPNTLWVGTPAGGLWRTNDLGTTWTPLTDGLPQVGISGIAVHPTNTDIIYILTGDGDSGHTRSIGVLKTINGGDTWLSTELSWAITDGVFGFKLVMDPTDPDILLAAMSNGVHRTTNGGITWDKTFTSGTYDIEFKSGDHNIMYLHTATTFHKSYDNGLTWPERTAGLPTGERRGAVGVTPADPAYVYVFTGGPPDTIGGSFTGLFRSTDSGETFTPKANTPNILGYNSDGSDGANQSSYDFAFAVDPTTEATIYTGGINVWKSTNFGDTMSNVTQWNEIGATTYTHADIHNIDFSPVDGSLFVCGDGGLYRSTNGGATFAKLSTGMCTMAFNDIADYEGDPNYIIGGTQDNGTNYKNSVTGTWNHIDGGDGSDVMIDHSDPAIMYLSANEYLVKTTNYGASTSIIGPSTNGWANLEMDPINSSRIYAGYNHGVYRSSNGGQTWDFICPTDSSVSGGVMIKLGTDYSNRLYTTDGQIFWRTDNPLQTPATWLDRTAGLPAGLPIREIAVDPDSSLKVAVCLGGYTDTSKVYISDNGGASWTNITGTLPNLPVNCIQWAPGSNNGLYVGADVGVYYRDDDIGDWLSFRNGLPHAPIFDIEIHEASGKLRAGTFGRGLWETATYTPCPNNYYLTDGNYSGSGSGGYRYFQSSDYLVSTRTIDGGVGTDVTYQAANYVHLANGFEVLPGNEFHAYNAPCTTIPMEYSTGTELTGTYEGPMPGVIEQVVGTDEPISETRLLAYPNPTMGIINIEFSTHGCDDLSLVITDMAGRSVKQLIGSQQIAPGSYKVATDLTDFGPGMYLAVLLNDGNRKTMRIAVTN